MTEWLLSDNGYPILLALLLIGAAFPLIALSAYIITIDEDSPGLLSVIITAISTTLSILLCLFIGFSVEFENISNESWKQIYTNNIEAKVKIDIKNYDLILKGKDQLVAGENIDKSQYKALKSNNDIHIIVEKNGTSYSKNVEINTNDIISDSELNLNSKITKIEYKNIQGHQRSLFGHKGPIEKDNIDGQIRITLEQDSTEKELKQMFEQQN